MEIFNDVSTTFSVLRKPSVLKPKFAYPLENMKRCTTVYGERIRIECVDPGLLSCRKFHILTGGRYLALTDADLAKINAKASEYVLIFSGQCGNANIIKLHPRAKWEDSILEAQKHAVQPEDQSDNGASSSDAVARARPADAAKMVDPTTEMKSLKQQIEILQ